MSKKSSKFSQDNYHELVNYYILMKALTVILNRESVTVKVYFDGFSINFVFLDVPLMVFETKIDKVCSDVDKDVEEVFYSESVKSSVDKVADVIAIPRSHVFPIKNYEKEGSLQTSISILALKALKQALLFSEDFLENES